MGFTEYIEVNSNVTVDSARHLTIEAGMYLCINLVLDEVHTSNGKRLNPLYLE